MTRMQGSMAAMAVSALLAGACSTVTPGDGQSVEKGHPFRA